MLAQIVLRQKNINSRLNYLLKKYSEQATASKTEYTEKFRFAPHRAKKPKIESFLAPLIAGHINEDLFDFPEVFTIQRYKDFHDWLNPIENYVSSCANTNKKLNKEEVLDNLRELGVFQAFMDKDYGLDLSETESLKFIEAVTTLPWLGAYLVKCNILPVKTLSKYGSESQKQEYYPKIINGEIIPTICVYEGDNKINLKNYSTNAIPIEGNSWLLNGQKTFVINAVNANLFLVFARTISKTSCKLEPESFSLFLVEKDNKNVVCSEVHDPLDRHEMPICTVNFNDVVIPNKNLIGEPGNAYNILMNFLKPGKHNISAQAISILRNFTNQLVTDILNTKHLDKELYEFTATKNVLGEIMFNLYTMESMAYFTSGLMDLHENSDMNLEAAITEAFCARKCLDSVQKGIQLLSGHNYRNNRSYVQTLHDALSLSATDFNDMDADVYIALYILQQLGKVMSDYVYKKRNLQKYPLYMFNFFVKKPIPEISIADYFHPMLKEGLIHFEEGTKIFINIVESLFIKEGSKIIDDYSALKVITEMILEMYGGITNLSRSSRSYCLGHRNTDSEKNIGMAMAYIMAYNMQAIEYRVQNHVFAFSNEFYKTTSELAYENHKYCIEHPTTRAIF